MKAEASNSKFRELKPEQAAAAHTLEDQVARHASIDHAHGSDESGITHQCNAARRSKARAVEDWNETGLGRCGARASILTVSERKIVAGPNRKTLGREICIRGA